MYSRSTAPSTVGWRFTIQSRAAGPAWTAEYTSKYQTAQATHLESAGAGHGFSRQAWTGPFNPDVADYRVIVEMQWWKAGSVLGYAKLRYNWYLGRIDGGDSFAIKGRCFATFAGA